METKETTGTNGTASNTKPDPSGFDLNGLLNNQSFSELLKHLLSGAGAMAGNYFMWIKPMQDKIDKLFDKAHEQEIRLKEMEREIEILKTANISKTNIPELKEGEPKYYFEVNRQKTLAGTSPKRKGLKI